MSEIRKKYGKVSLEEAINITGFGAYNYLMTGLSGVTIIAYTCTGLNSSMIVPTSACELGTTTAQQGLLASGPFIGLIFGGLIWGCLSDSYGRRKMMLVSLVSGAVFNILASFSVNWVMLLILQTITSVLTSGLYSMSMTLLSETVPMAKRNLVVLHVSSIFLLYQGIMALIAMPVIPLNFSYHIPVLNIYFNSWRTLMLLFTGPAIVATIWMFFMQESPKYMFAKGDTKRTMKILRTIYIINNGWKAGEFPTMIIESGQPIETKKLSKDQVFPLFKSPHLKNTAIITLLSILRQVGVFNIWMPTIANQFMPILETGNGAEKTVCDMIRETMDNPQPTDADITPCSLNTFSMLLVLVVSSIQSATNILISLIVDHVGRRNLVVIISAICGGSGILINLVPNAVASAVLFVILMEGLAIQGLYTAITVALFPTQLRTMAVSFTMSGGRLMAFASTQIFKMLLANNCDLDFYIFTSVFASTALVALLLPDDRRMQRKSPVPPHEENKDNNTLKSEVTKM